MGYHSSRTRGSIISSHGRTRSSMDSVSSSSACTTRTSSHKAGRNNKMRCIVAIGVTLPIMAAVIGVTAWAVGSESVMQHGSSTHQHPVPSYSDFRSSAFRSDFSSAFSNFEERNDLMNNQKVQIGSAVPKDILGSETVIEDEADSKDILSEMEFSPPLTPEKPKDDPLYVVHYVPQEVPKDFTANSTPSPPTNDVLSKILSASKGTGKNTPQFVVFAPIPSNDEPDVNTPKVTKHYDEEEEITQPSSSYKRIRKLKKQRKQMTDELHDDGSRDYMNSQTSSRNEQQEMYAKSHHFQHHHMSPDSGPRAYHNSQNNPTQHGQHVNLRPWDTQSHAIKHVPHPGQQMRFQQPQIQSAETSQRSVQPTNHVPCCQYQNQNHYGPARGYPSHPFADSHQEDEHDADRHGSVVPQGVTITLGKNLPLSPLGILKSLIKPLSPSVDLKKKLFFGVQLENGFNLGKQNNGGGQHSGLTISG